VSDEQGDLGFLYLDLYSRKGKYPGCAHLAVQGRGDYQTQINYQVTVYILFFTSYFIFLYVRYSTRSSHLFGCCYRLAQIGMELFGVCILAKLSSTYQYIIPFAILVRVMCFQINYNLAFCYSDLIFLFVSGTQWIFFGPYG
jgi:hypothetical protein